VRGACLAPGSFHLFAEKRFVMPFWSLFWLVVPPLLLLMAGVLYYIMTGKDEE